MKLSKFLLILLDGVYNEISSNISIIIRIERKGISGSFGAFFPEIQNVLKSKTLPYCAMCFLITWQNLL